MVRAFFVFAVSLGLAFADGPRNLDFREGLTGQTPTGWQVANGGYTGELRRDGCPDAGACVVILPPATPGTEGGKGSLFQTFDAVPYRGKTLRVSAWLRLDAMDAKDQAAVWFRVDSPFRNGTTMDALGAYTLSRTAWTRSDVRFAVDPEAVSITIGVFSVGRGRTWIRDFEIAEIPPPQAASLDPQPSRATGWFTTPDYEMASVRKGCKVGPECQTLERPARTKAAMGALVHRVSVDPYRGHAVRVRGWVRIDRTVDGWAGLWTHLKGDHDDPNMNFRSVNEDYRPASRAGEWTLCEIVRRIEPGDRTLDFGVMLMNGGRAWIDGLTIEAAPDADIELTTDHPPSAEELNRMVNAAAVFAGAYTAKLPDFLCTETIRRMESHSGVTWRPKDVLTVQLGYSDGAERYKLMSIDSAATSASLASMRGALFEGEFGSMLREIFRAQAAQFEWAGDGALRDRAVHVLRYRIDAAKSNYNVHFGGSNGKTADITAGHHGVVYVDSETSEVLRLTQIADLPRNFPVRNSITTINYGYSEVAGQRYLLPLSAQIELGSGTIQTRNEIGFAEYKKFAADSSIRFEDQ